MELREKNLYLNIMSRQRKTYNKKFKLMSVELSKQRTDLVALAKELDIPPCSVISLAKGVVRKAREKLFRQWEDDFERIGVRDCSFKKDLRDT
ncbi:hypothetical protein GCM10022209_26800 [Chitinophaga oryziterrae]